MKIAVTGATGLIGQKLVARLLQKNHNVIVLSRSEEKVKKIFHGKVKAIKWNPYSENSISKIDELEGINSFVHLAGENVMSRRWNEEHKKNIYESRINSTKSLFTILSELKDKPESFISASAVGFYDNSISNVADEYSSSGNDFLASVTSDWENEVKKFSNINIREVRIRIGIVLDKNGGALKKLLPAFKMFVGGSIASGKQWFPWIHIDDIVDLFVFAIENPTMSGAYNAVSPGITTMLDFSKTLANVLSRPLFFSIPSFVLKVLFGEAAYTLINGAKILPVRTLESGFVFKYEKLKPALEDLLK